MQSDSEVKNKVLNPTVVKLGLVSLFADISSEMLYPITPIFLTTVLGASMTSVGIIEGLAELIASLLKFYSGLWSDRLGRRKPFIVIGYFISAIAKPLVGREPFVRYVIFSSLICGSMVASFSGEVGNPPALPT